MIARSQIRVTHGVKVTSLNVTSQNVASQKVYKSPTRSVVSAKSLNNPLINGLLGNSMTRAMTTTKLHEYMINKELSPAYIETVERAVDTIRNKYNITTPSTSNAIKLKAMLRAKGRSDNTVRLYTWAMRYWAKSLKRDIDLKECPTPIIEEKPIEIVDFKIIRKILDDPNISERSRAIIALISFSGCRVRELVKLKVDDLKLDEGNVTYRRTKGKKKFRTVPLTPEAVEIMQGWMEIRNRHLAALDKESEYVFIVEECGPMSEDLVRQTLNRMKKEIGLKKLSPHLLRHTAATKMANVPGVNLRDVQDMLGHSSVTITERYVHPQYDQIKTAFTKNLRYD